MRGKPTKRFMYSQNSYCDDFIGIPHVYSLSIKDEKFLREILNNIKNQSLFPAYLPHEYSYIGMLERMYFFMSKQNLCEIKYPDKKSLVIINGSNNQDCQTVCQEKKMMCEYDFFNLINTLPANKECLKLLNYQKLVLPAKILIENNYAFCPQTEHLYYSCVDKSMGAYRICPCRKYSKGNIAIY
uniref:alpha-1,6-mannosyl-glycoprotein 6-beta-N-acetylglucosaminyltransferase n=1 Tax=Henneguya salminicola TaxID=69463 RepID=A0A6G3MK14_HENSL